MNVHRSKLFKCTTIQILLYFYSSKIEKEYLICKVRPPLVHGTTFKNREHEIQEYILPGHPLIVCYKQAKL